MNTSPPEETPRALCDYCGKENPELLPSFAGCGKPLVYAPPGPPRKSRALALFLTAVFGPLGLLYVRGWYLAAVLILIGLVLRLAGLAGLWFTVGARIFCMIWVWRLLNEMDEPVGGHQDAVTLLNRAARLESYDRAEAIAAYEEIIHLHPGTPAAWESRNNIELLKRQFDKA